MAETDNEKPKNDRTAESETDSSAELDGAALDKKNESTEKAVDDIVRHESDDVLQKEDAELNKAFQEPATWLQKAKNCFRIWWQTPKYRYGSLAGLAVLLVLLFAIPYTRYGMLNAMGARASLQVTVLDGETDLPLKNVHVSVAGMEMLTDRRGEAHFSGVRLGNSELVVNKIAYAEHLEPVTVGLGSNQAGPVGMVATGTQYTFSVRDWLSDMPIADAEAVYGDSSALSDEEGNIKLNVDAIQDSTLEVTVTADSYAEQTVEINTTTRKTTGVSMIADTRNYFVSSRNGQYDLYGVNADGSDEELILPGTGNETDQIRFSVSPDHNVGVLSASRQGQRNKDGYMLQELYLVDLHTKELQKIDQSEYIDMAGWIDGRLIYIKIAKGASGRNPERHRLMSYDVEARQAQQLAASNYFNDVLVAQNYVFYAPSDAFKKNPQPYLFRIGADGGDKQTVFERETWQIVRTDYDTLYFDSRQEWYKADMNELIAIKQDGPPAERLSRIYSVSPDGEKGLWVDKRDGKGVLILEDLSAESSESTVLQRQGGLRNPVRWLNDKHVVYRVVSDVETADYIMNIEGGEPQKVNDAANVSGTDRFYYYY